MASFYSKQKNLKKALEYYEQVQTLIKNYVNSPLQKGNLLGIMGFTYTENNDYKNALWYQQESLKYYSESNDIHSSVSAQVQIGTSYYNLGNFSKALEYHNRAVQITDSLGDPYKANSWFIHLLAKDYYATKSFTRAKELNSKALVDFKRDWFDVSGRLEMELLAMQIDSAIGNGYGALSHYREYASLKAKNENDEVKKEAQKEKFKAEVEKQKADQEKKDAIAMRTRNLQYIAIGAFLLLGIFLTYGYIQKNKDKKSIEKAYSELRSTQSQLIQSEKMASLGELTAGIAHEIQNPLNFVNNFSELNNELAKELDAELTIGNEQYEKGNPQLAINHMQQAKDLVNDIKENSEKINHHGKRAESIVKGMLEHSRKSSGVKELTDINKLCDELVRLSYHGLKAKDKEFNCDYKLDLDPKLQLVNVVSQDFGRVILNIVNNAFQACNEKSQYLNKKSDNINNQMKNDQAPDSPSGGGGKELVNSEISFSPPAPKEEKDSVYHPLVTILTKNMSNKIEIRISDNGPGISDNIKDKIFQPFFTTKPTGQGTGLGLSLAYDIVKAHGGEINVKSEVGLGTEFIIQLPIIQ